VRCLAEMGEFDEGTRLGEEGLRMAEEFKHPLSLVQMCVGLGHLHTLRGDVNRAIPVLERGLSVSRHWNISLYVARLGSAVGRAYLRTGRVAEALELLKQGAEDQAVLGQAGQLARLAEGYLAVGEPARAWEQAEKALDLSRRYKEKGLEAWILHLRGDVAALRDPADVESAARIYHEAMAIAQGLGMRPALAHCHVGLGELNARAGRRGPARDHLAAASALFRDMGMTAGKERAERGLGELQG
jgi:tetratricopeptide (TPR) repeat protein